MKNSSKTKIAAILILSFSCIYILGCSQPGEAAKGSAVGIHQVLSPDSVEIYYQVHSEGEHALVFVHCWCCDKSYWDNQIDAFKNDYMVVTVDLAGHGESGQNRETWDMQHYGADVASVINLLGDHEIILIGHSMGGAVCIEAARQASGNITAIIGVDTYQDFAQKLKDEQINMFLAAFKADFPATTNQFVRSMFGSQADTALVNSIAVDMSSAPPEIAISSITALLKYDAVSALKQMQKPIRAINADRFPTNAAGNDSIASSFRVTLMPGLGHFVHMEDSENFNSLLHDVLTEFWPE